jgi:ElaB/YqjD/DUF883 family membrane-anchored ribosome-binding protein
MKYIYLIITVLIFSGCFGEEETKKVVKKEAVKKVVKKEPVKELVKKVKVQSDTNESFSDTIEADGIVVDGARDEELLDAFGLAVSQIMTEEGVSVPDCTAIAKTEYLTKEECDEISEKYFGFYDIYTEDGVARKIEDVFEDGVAGEDVEIRNEQVEYFDSSGNPLLDNLIEFEEFVDESNDEEVLTSLLSNIPNEKTELKEKVQNKLDFLKDVIKQTQEDELQKVQEVAPKEEKENTKIEETSYDSAPQEEGLTKSQCLAKNSQLNDYKSQLKRVEMDLNNQPDNEKHVDRYNDITMNISILESEVESCR